jgi:hypothetical protein
MFNRNTDRDKLKPQAKLPSEQSLPGADQPSIPGAIPRSEFTDAARGAAATPHTAKTAKTTARILNEKDRCPFTVRVTFFLWPAGMTRHVIFGATAAVVLACAAADTFFIMGVSGLRAWIG